MKIIRSKNAGFCPGVRRADEAVRELIKNAEPGQNIFTLGKLIHNDLYNSELEGLGVLSVDLDFLEEFLTTSKDKVTLVVRTHGITKESEDKLVNLCRKYKNFSYVDMTCPFVKKIHNIAKENTNENTYFLLYGSPSHPESIGIISYAFGEKQFIGALEDLETINFGNKVPILCSQTTQNLL